jgi:protein SCO1/2
MPTRQSLFPPEGHWFWPAAGVFLVGMLILTGGLIYIESQPRISGTISSQPAELPVLSELPAFSFTDQDRQTFGSEQLGGTPWVANFVFTSCPTVCPTFTAGMRRLKARMASTRGQLNWVSISVDPETDTPSVLKEYAVLHGADSPDWRFLTGPGEEIRSIVVEGFKTALAPDPDQVGNILHGSHFVLVDRQLRLRGYYGADDPEALERLVADATQLSSTPSTAQ